MGETTDQQAVRDAAMREQIALDDTLKAELLDLEAKLPTADHFTLLGVPRDAEAATVKAAFFQLCKRVHPDRYFRKELGSFKKRLELVFKALSRAHQTLTDPVKREAYLQANPALRHSLPKRAPGQRISLNKKDLQLGSPPAAKK